MQAISFPKLSEHDQATAKLNFLTEEKKDMKIIIGSIYITYDFRKPQPAPEVEELAKSAERGQAKTIDRL